MAASSTSPARRPSLTNWSGGLSGPYGNFNTGDLRGAASGPIVANKLAVGVGFGYSTRDGFTKNDVTGNDLDSRSAVFGKGQLLWKPNARWEARAHVQRRARARRRLRAQRPGGASAPTRSTSSRDFEGFTHRDILAQTVQVTYAGPRVDFSTTTGFLKWKTEDLTDLDYTPLPLITRNNAEEDFQFTEEARFSSAKAAPVVALGSRRP